MSVPGPDRPAPAAAEAHGLDALLPAAMAAKAEDLGARKARLDAPSLLTLAVLAGAFIALGAMFAMTVLAGTGGTEIAGLGRLLAGLVFALGLILVIVGGAELFTGNTLMVMALAGRRIGLGEMLRAWALVYAGNFLGAVGTAGLVFLAGQYLFEGGRVGLVTLEAALFKVSLPFWRLLFLGILCNVLVCLAVWLSLGARSAVDKVAVIVPPVAAFVAAGYEHSVANMYLIPLGLLIRWWAPPEFWAAAGAEAAGYEALTLTGFAWNLLPVTIGNVIGGAGLVGAVYWFVYLRRR